MAATYDLIIRNGLLVDGKGGAPVVGDIAVAAGRIALMGEVAGAGTEEIDARGLVVTPGFVDVHTHYDGQAIWSDRLNPSSLHGATTVVLGNCGVGFAPCRQADRALLIHAMEGVEDIPEIVLAEGLTWEWESFPQFLQALEARPHDIDFAVYIPHTALRVYVMGERGTRRDPATDEDLGCMQELVEVAMKAGAVGFSTSTLFYHRSIDGQHLPSYLAAERELHAVAKVVGKYGGVFQIVSRSAEGGDEAHARQDFEFLSRIAKIGNVTVTFTAGQADFAPYRLPVLLDWVEHANDNATPHAQLRPQLFPRPVGMILSLGSSANPFMERPSFKALAGLSLDEQIARLRRPEVRARILTEISGEPTLPLLAMVRKFNQMFPLGSDPDYEPAAEQSIAAIASRTGVTPDEVAYDYLLKDDGRGMLLVTLANYSLGSLEPIREQLMRKDVVLGLGDGGAHYGLICDASYTTFMLTYWCRDRVGHKFPIAQAVRALTAIPAALMGFGDRGVLERGRRADINLIDMDRLRLHAPTVVRDLPGGGRRLDQRASGYRYTLVNGRIIQRDGQATGELPGRLLRKTVDNNAGAEY
jgi:N-acyl-D-amino-acid deacylase